MKKWIFGIVIAAAMAAMGATLAQAASTNNFVITNFTADYHLDVDEDNRSTLKTVERITADFPQSDQNHGLERALPLKFDGHTVKLKIDSITDADGKNLDYKTEDSYGNTVLRIGDKNRYAHGENTYVITYTQRDVTRFYGDTGSDEFYWNVNGTAWQVPTRQLSATVHLGNGVTGGLSGKSACYQGASGDTEACAIAQSGDTFKVTANGKLAANENMTLAIGFNEGTFAPYEMSTFDRVLDRVLTWWVYSLVVTAIIAAIITAWAGIVWSRRHNRSSELGTIVPEYLPPPDASVLLSASVIGESMKAFSAQLIDFAVRHYIKVYQTSERKGFTSAEYELELVKKIDDLSTEEQALLTQLFPNKKVGDRFKMKELGDDFSLSIKVRSAAKPTLDGSYHLRQPDEAGSKVFKRWGKWTLWASLVTLSPFLLGAGAMLFGLGSSLRPLSDKGLALKRYLMGLKQYIKVAEVDRIKMLQSPEGAEKTGVTLDGDQPAEMVRLYERVLPYAVLFNQEAEWNKRLGAYYESADERPDWYAGSGAFNAVALGAALTSFSNAATYASSSSSSSGGSGGGGFSGGGGGGGGGGGW